MRVRILLMTVALLTGWAGAAPDLSLLRGSYVGDFVADHMDPSKSPSYQNKINLSVDSVQDGRIKGHSVVAGNLRPFSGTLTEKDGRFEVQAKEPGDDQYDGVFRFTLDPAAKMASGIWIANNKKLAVTQRKYALKRASYRYNPKLSLMDGVPRVNRSWEVPVYDTYNRHTDKWEAITKDAFKLNASTTLLRSQDVENMYRTDLEVTRNAIYARHGYSFQNRAMRYFFDRVDWYIPVSINVTAQLTDLERKNIEILKRYENHAATYYDRFGR